MADMQSAKAQGDTAQSGNNPQSDIKRQPNLLPREKTWPQFRGHNADGIGSGDIPLTWSKTKNVAWRTEIPGVGHSSPIVWGDKIFVTSAVPKSGKATLKLGGYETGKVESAKDRERYEFKLFCINGGNGKIKWSKTATSSVPKIDRHPKSSFANPTPATDGKVVIASFGPDGLFAFDMKGKELWSKDLGNINAGFFADKDGSQWGFTSSPIITPEGKLVVQVDVHPNYSVYTEKGDKGIIAVDPRLGSNSYIAAMDPQSGREIWKTRRDEIPTFGTPTYVPTSANGGGQVVTNGYKEIAGYDASTGVKIWSTNGRGDIPISTPVYIPDHNGGSGMILFTAVHGADKSYMCVTADAKGDGVTPKAINLKTGDYVPTPVASPDGKVFYSAGPTGLFGGYNLQDPALEGIYADGKRQRIGAFQVSSSPVIAKSGGNTYVLVSDEDGTTHVVKSGKDFGVVAANSLPESIMATPAVVDGTVIIRTTKAVYAIRKPSGKK